MPSVVEDVLYDHVPPTQETLVVAEPVITTDKPDSQVPEKVTELEDVKKLVLDEMTKAGATVSRTQLTLTVPPLPAESVCVKV